jgi:hypothetical protein
MASFSYGGVSRYWRAGQGNRARRTIPKPEKDTSKLIIAQRCTSNIGCAQARRLYIPEDRTGPSDLRIVCRLWSVLISISAVLSLGACKLINPKPQKLLF